MKQNPYKILFFFVISFWNACIKSSDNYHLITVGNQVIPSPISWPKIPSINKPPDWKHSSLVTKKTLYRDIIPFERYLGLTQKPILIYEKIFSPEEDINAFAFFREDPNVPHLIIIPSPAKKHIPTIFHELVHIYLKYKKKLLPKNHFLQLRYFVPIIIKSILLQQFEEPFFNFISIGYYTLGLYLFITHKTRMGQIEEMICDSYASLFFNPNKIISLIDQDINYFEKDLSHDTNVFFTDYLYYSTHPSHKKRISCLKKIKELVRNNQRIKIETWIKDLEHFLFGNSSPMHFMFGIPNLT